MTDTFFSSRCGLPKTWAATPVLLIRRDMGSVAPPIHMGESIDSWPCHCRVAGVWSDLLSPRSLFFRCFISRYLSCGSDMMVSARCVSVLMTLILCSIGW